MCTNCSTHISSNFFNNFSKKFSTKKVWIISQNFWKDICKHFSWSFSRNFETFYSENYSRIFASIFGGSFVGILPGILAAILSIIYVKISVRTRSFCNTILWRNWDMKCNYEPNGLAGRQWLPDIRQCPKIYVNEKIIYFLPQFRHLTWSENLPNKLKFWRRFFRMDPTTNLRI